MKKGNIIFSVCVILMMELVIVYSYYYNKNKKTDTVVADQAEFKSSIIYDSNGNLIYDEDSNEIDEVVENTTVQGMVEVKKENKSIILWYKCTIKRVRIEINRSY